MGLAELLARTKSTFTNDASPIQWSPSTHPLPNGWQSTRQQLQLPSVASHSTLKFKSTGLWATGTVLFCYEEEDDDDGGSGGGGNIMSQSPPDYQAAATAGGGGGGQRGTQLGGKGDRGTVQVQVESRYNDESLINDSKATAYTSGDDYTCGIDLVTSNSKPRASALSFYITYTIPRSITSLNALVVDSSQFRIILDPSMAALSIATIQISTSDAPVMLPALTGIGSLSIKNLNRLDPSRRAMQCHDDLITTLPIVASSGQSIRSVRSVSSTSRNSMGAGGSGRGIDNSKDMMIVRAESILLQCENGAISGRWETTRGHLSVSTTNFPITGQYHAEGALRVSTTNDIISGSFISRSTRPGAGGILADAQQGRVEGTFESRGPVRINAINAPIMGSFVVGSELAIKTTHFKIDANVEIMPALSVGGGARGVANLAIPGTAAPNLYLGGGYDDGPSPPASYIAPPTERRPSIDPPPSLHPGSDNGHTNGTGTASSLAEPGTSPTQSVLSFVSSTGTVTQPPTFEQALRNGARPQTHLGQQQQQPPPPLPANSQQPVPFHRSQEAPSAAYVSGSAAGTSGTSLSSSAAAPYGSVVTVSAETNEGQVTLEFSNQPRDVVLHSTAQSSGGAKVSIRHPADWTGQFQVSTTIYSQASVHFAPDVASPLDDVDRHHHSGRRDRDRDRDRVHFTSKKRHEVAGSIRGTGSGAGSDSSTTAAGLANGLATSGRQLLSQNVTKVVAKGPAEIYFF